MWSPPGAHLGQLQLSSIIDAHDNMNRAAKVRSYAQVLNEAYLKVGTVFNNGCGCYLPKCGSPAVILSV